MGYREPPYFLNPFIMPNSALPLSYFNCGIAIYMLSTPVTYYLIYYLSASSAQYNAYATLVSLPWSFKFAFGLLSDGNPLNGYRRKSWLAIGWILFIVFNFILASIGTPDIATTTALMFLMTCSYLLGDVCCDTSCVERARYETSLQKGSLQTSGYTIRAFGSIIGAILGAVLYNTYDWGWGLTIAQLFLLSGIIPLSSLLPLVYNLDELEPSVKPPSFLENCQNIFDTLKLKAVWKPMSFVFIYYMFQVPNSAWSNFLVLGLGFSDFELGMLTVASAAMSWIGLIVYKQFFFQSSWRDIYIYTTILGAIFSLLQILLILRVNVSMGIPDVAFALGDYSITALMYAIQGMPACIMFVMLCPDGSEGVTYALLTTISNLAYTVASDIGSACTYIWDVSNATLEAGDYSGILKLTILTSLLQIAPICLVFILPDSKDEVYRLIKSGGSSYNAGLILLIVIIVSLLVTIIVNVVLIFDN